MTAPARTSWWRGATAWVAMLGGLLAIALAGLWAWAGTPESLAWAWARWAAPLGVEASGLQGSLRAGLRADRLAYARGDLRLQAEAVSVDWQWVDLLRERVHLTRVQAGTLRVATPESPNPRGAPPRALALPVAVDIDSLEIGQLTWLRDGADAEPPLAAEGVRARYAYDLRHHRLWLREARAGPLRLSGEATVADRDGLPIGLQLRGAWDLAPGTAPASLVLQVEGPIASPRVRGHLATAASGQARLDAQLAPWERPAWRSLRLTLQDIDLAATWPARWPSPPFVRPATALTGTLTATPLARDDWQLEADLANAAPGPWDAGRLPLSRLRLRGQWRGSQALVQSMHARIGQGTVDGEGQWLDARRWRWRAEVAGLAPADLHRALTPQRVDGQLQAQAEGPVLQARARLRARGPDLSGGAAKGTPKGNATYDGVTRADAAPALQAQADARLRLRPPPRGARGDAAPQIEVDGSASIDAPGLRLRAQGRIAADDGAGEARLQVADLARARAWLARLPGLAPADATTSPAGHASLDLAWQGGWNALTLIAHTQATLAGWPQAAVRHLQLEGAARAQRDATGAWQGRLDALQAQWQLVHGPGPGSLRLLAPVPVKRATDGRINLGAGEASLVLAPDGPPARLSWEDALWHPDPAQATLRTRGQVRGLPWRWGVAALGPEGSGLPQGDLAFDGRWDLRWGPGLAPQLHIALARTRGDLSVLTETADGLPTRLAAGVRQAGLWIDADGPALAARLRWASERAGQAEARLATRLSAGGPLGQRWADDAPLQGRVQARLPRLAVWSALAPAGWRLRGTLAADLDIAGTRAQPRVAGSVQADRLGLRSVVDGIALQDGRLRARIDGRRAFIDELSLRGPGAQGLLHATGEALWPAGAGWQVTLQARLERLRASVRPDRDVTASGQVRLAMDPQRLQLQADLRVDRARIVLPASAAPQLSEDVVVRGLPGGRQMGAGRSAPPWPWQARASIDLGDDFRLAARGANLRLRGAVDVEAESAVPLRMTGTVRTAEGTFAAWGQTLAIEHGVLRFTGAPDDPALDVLAVRPDPVQREGVRVGVQVTGTGRAPRLRLWSEPELPEAQKLSWLLLGRPASGSGAETALLEDAALSLLARRAGVNPVGLARRFGLDELGLRREGAEGAALTLGKRLADRLYAVYERSLSGTLGTLWVFYDLTRRLTLRAQAGERSGVDLVYTLSFD